MEFALTDNTRECRPHGFYHIGRQMSVSEVGNDLKYIIMLHILAFSSILLASSSSGKFEKNY
jgi:hypothetical protein